jgi:hypothetical protein
MRVSKPIILYLPKLLLSELDNYLKQHPPNFKFQKVYFYYIIHHLTVMQIQNKDNEYFYLNLKKLINVTVSNIGRYIKILKDDEFIICENYSVGVKSNKYKINPKFAKDLIEFKIPHFSKLNQKIIKSLYKKKANYNRLEPHLKAMQKELMQMELDYPAANKWIEINANDIQELSYLTAVNHIEDKRFRYFKRNRTNGRLDTNLTNLKSELRQFIKGDYVSIDLKNSQPFQLGILIDNIINNKDTLCCYFHEGNIIKAFGVKAIQRILFFHQNQEKAGLMKLRLFYNSVLSGILYDEFRENYSGKISRKEAKKKMFKVLFSRNEYFSGYKKTIPYESDKEAFASVYPFVAEVVKILKTKDHRTLPIYLQQLESYLFIDCIAKELVVNGIIPFTIHDSVIVKVGQLDRAVEIMNKIFNQQLGITPTYDIKLLNITQTN